MVHTIQNLFSLILFFGYILQVNKSIYTAQSGAVYQLLRFPFTETQLSVRMWLGSIHHFSGAQRIELSGTLAQVMIMSH